MLYLVVPFVLVLGAFGRRAAGGVLNQWTGRPDSRPLTGDTPTRILYGVTIGLAALLGGALWWHALLTVPAVWVGTTTGNAGSMAMGRAQTPFWRDFLGMSGHAALSAILPTALAFGVGANGWWTLLTLAAAPLYDIGWALAGKTGNPRFPLGLRGGSEIGEALWGAAVALGAYLAFAA